MRTYTIDEMKRAFECGRIFQLTAENNFQELIEELNQALHQPLVSGSLLIRSLILLEEMIDNHDADAVRMTDVHYAEVKKLIKDIRRSKRLQ